MTEPQMLACGDAAHAIHRDAHDGLPENHPSCVVHDKPAACTVVATPTLGGRRARCADYSHGWTGRSFEGLMGGADKTMSRCTRAGCYCEAPSSTGLAFFEYRGPGSTYGAEHCTECRYTSHAHRGGENYGRMRPTISHEFDPRGASEFDTFYCGCKGWD